MNNLVIPSIILGMSIVGVGLLHKPCANKSIASRYTLRTGTGGIVFVMDTFTGRLSSRSLTNGKDHFRKVLFPAPIAIGDKFVCGKQVREWRSQGYTDGEIFDTIALKFPKAAETFEAGFSESEVVETFIKDSSFFSEKQE